ncbi:MAG: STAS domain-containing protein [Candidatus Acidiferrales bacterium]
MPPETTGVATTELKLQTIKRDDATVIQCAGRLTSEHAAALKSYVKDAIPQAKRIILDLAEVTKMDSLGLGALVGLYVSARKAKCELVLVNYNKSIKELLGITNLLSVFEDYAQSGMRIP